MKLNALPLVVLLGALSLAQAHSATIESSKKSGGYSGGGPSQTRLHPNLPPGSAAKPGGGAAQGSRAYTSGGGRGSPIQLLQYKRIQEDLALTGPQKESILAIIRRFNDTEKQTLARPRTKTPSKRPSLEQQNEALRQALARATGEIKRTLTPEQVKRLQQLVVQHQGAEALFDPEVAKALQLSDAQKQTLKNMRSEEDRQIGALLSPPAPRPRPAGSHAGSSRNGSAAGGSSGTDGGASREMETFVAGRNEKIAQVIRESERKMLGEVLTPDQQAKLKELQGRPYALPKGYLGSTARSGGNSFSSGHSSKP